MKFRFSIINFIAYLLVVLTGLAPLAGAKWLSGKFILHIVVVVSIFIFTQYLLRKKELYQANLLRREIELQQLKSQLNPHFLFNALNNIYSYTLHSNKFGNELILKLSELMRFILESSDKQKILLTSEINFIENYIAFEKERLSQRCAINYSKKLQHENRDIVPLILFPFIENAFKHGADTIEMTTIDIFLYDDDYSLKLLVKNSIVNKGLPSTKLGLHNATRRLELFYPERHNLKINTANETFIVDLTLKYDKDKSANS